MPNLYLENFDQSEASIGSHMTRMVPEDVSKGPLGIPAKKISSCADTLLLAISLNEIK